MNRGVQPWSTKVSNFKPTFLVLKIYVNDEFKIYVNEEFLAPHMLLKWHVARCNKSSRGTIPKLTDEDALLWCSPLMQIWILWSYDVNLKYHSVIFANYVGNLMIKRQTTIISSKVVHLPPKFTKISNKNNKVISICYNTSILYRLLVCYPYKSMKNYQENHNFCKENTLSLQC